MAVDDAFKFINAAIDDATKCDVMASYRDATTSSHFIGATINILVAHLYTVRTLSLPNEEDVAAIAADAATAAATADVAVAEPSHVAIDHSYFTANDDSTYLTSFNY